MTLKQKRMLRTVRYDTLGGKTGFSLHCTLFVCNIRNGSSLLCVILNCFALFCIILEAIEYIVQFFCIVVRCFQRSVGSPWIPSIYIRCKLFSTIFRCFALICKSFPLFYIDVMYQNCGTEIVAWSIGWHDIHVYTLK